MRIYTDLKPKIYKAYTKEDVISKLKFLNSGHYLYTSSSRFGDAYYDYSSDKVVLYSLQKRRKIWGVNKHWVAYCYYVDVSLLESMKVMVSQKDRHFTITSK